jgi:hypothetical protein
MDTAKAISKAQRDKIDSSDFAGPDRSYPCDTRAHAQSAIRLYGKADDPAKVKAAIIRILKRKGWDDLIPDAWGATKDVTMDSTLVHFGGAVKALGDDGKIGGYLVTFGDADTPDLSGTRDFFTKDTDFDIETGEKRSVYYSHGLDATMGVKKIGALTVTDMAKDDHGVWVEAQLKMRDKYEQAIFGMVKEGKLGWSSGAPTHLVRRKAIKTDEGTVHEILHWPIGEGSLTPTPAEPRCDAFALKSLGAMIGMDDGPPDAEDHTVKALPSGMSYDDLRSLLQDELNEDFPATDPDGDATPYGGLYIVDIYDDALVYRDDDDLYRIPYTVTSGNDVTWGDAECVIRTTVYQSVTGEDADTNAVPITGMAGKQAQIDVTALKAMLRASMTLDDHAAVVQDAMAGFATRAEGLCDLAVKSGRPMSAARHAKLKQTYAGLRTAHTATEGHLQALNDLLLSTDPDKATRDAKKDVDEIAALRMRHERIKAGHREVAI